MLGLGGCTTQINPNSLTAVLLVLLSLNCIGRDHYILKRARASQNHGTIAYDLFTFIKNAICVRNRRIA